MNKTSNQVIFAQRKSEKKNFAQKKHSRKEFRTHKLKKPEGTQCVQKENMNCRGLPGKRRDEKALQTKKTKRRENPRLTSYFPEEYTVCQAGNHTT